MVSPQTVVAAGVSQTVGVLSANDVPPLPPSLGVVVLGHGNGHGVGLSQWGAFSWAKNQNKSAAEILAFYYGADSVLSKVSAQESTSEFSVSLSAFNDRTRLVFVSPSADVPLFSSAVGAGVVPVFGSLVFEVVPNSAPPKWRVAKSVSRSCTPTGLVEVPGTFGPSTVFSPISQQPDAPVTSLPLVCSPTGALLAYRGVFAIRHGTLGELRLVNVVSVESYLRTVVVSEMPSSWALSAPQAVLAQVVAARSYALADSWARTFTYKPFWPQFFVAHARYSYARTCDTQSCQVYAPAGSRTGISAALVVRERPLVSALVLSSDGVVLRSAATSRVVLAMFSSSNGGLSVAVGLFPSVVDRQDTQAFNPWANWYRTLLFAEVLSKFPTVGVVQKLDVVTGDFGRVVSVRVVGRDSTVVVSGATFRSVFALPSAYFASV